MIVVMNLLVFGMAVAVGWLGAEVAGDVIEQRLVTDMVKNAAGLMGRMNLPTTDALMDRLSQIYGVPVAVRETKTGAIVASSLPPGQTAELRRRIGEVDSVGPVMLGETGYHVGSGDIVRPTPYARETQFMRLYMLVPEAQLQQSKDRASRRIAGLTLPAVVVATLLAFGLAMTIVRPIRKLAERMDRIAANAGEQGAPPAAAGESRRGPTEVARLAESFDHLLGDLRDAQEQLAQAERLATLGRVSASVAHELRNPLSGIKMNLRVLQDQLEARDVDQRSLELILHEIERMDLYLQELLSLAAGPVEAGEAAPTPEDLPLVRLDETVDSVVALLAGRCEHAGVTVLRDYSPGARWVRADASAVRQVIMNLIVNALEAMPGGGQIRLGLCNTGTGTVRFSAADSGTGVRADGMDIFAAFTGTKPKGAGLGLYVCRQISARCGGESGDDDSTAGATFWFELPTGAAQGG